MYILTRSRVQLYYHIIHLWTSTGICGFTLNSIFWLLDMFCWRGYTSFTPIGKERHHKQKMNTLFLNFILNRLLCLRNKLPEVNYPLLVHVWAQKTSNLLLAQLPLFSPDESPYLGRMNSTWTVIMTTKKTLLRWKLTEAMVWGTTQVSHSLPGNLGLSLCNWGWKNGDIWSRMLSDRILYYPSRMPNWWERTSKTAVSLFDPVQRKWKSSIWPFKNGTAAE